MKYAAAYRKGGTILIHSESKTVTGLRQGSEPFITLPADAEPNAIATALSRALTASRSGVPTLTEMSELVKPLLEAFDVKNWSSFVKGTVCVIVRADEARLHFLPTTNMGAREGFRHRPEQELHIPSNAPSPAISDALKRAFDLAKAPE